MKFSEEQKQKLCDQLFESLKSVRLRNGVQLVDKLTSKGNTIIEGLGEIETLVDNIYFDMETWEIPNTCKSYNSTDEILKEFLVETKTRPSYDLSSIKKYLAWLEKKLFNQSL